MTDVVTAVTPLLKRFEQWRIEHGRDPRTGRPLEPGLPVQRGRPLKRCDVDPKHLIVLALKMAAQHTARDDLRPLYRELAELFETKPAQEQP